MQFIARCGRMCLCCGNLQLNHFDGPGHVLTMALTPAKSFHSPLTEGKWYTNKGYPLSIDEKSLYSEQIKENPPGQKIMQKCLLSSGLKAALSTEFHDACQISGILRLKQELCFLVTWLMKTLYSCKKSV